MEVNYEDKRFEQVEADKNAAMQEIDQTYGNMIDQSDSFYQQQIEASKQWADTQSQLQQDQTDFTIEQIEQQKAQAQKDYTKEQSGAYVDWKKQSQQHGVNAEQMASSGMTNTGFSESSQVSMYNTYQNRVATAREVFSQAVLAYDNNIKEARLQNNAVLAEIAFQSLQQQLELSLQGFQYKNQLILDQANKKLEVDNMYYGRYQDVLEQLNYENAVAEEIRQWNENMDFEKEKFDEANRQWNESIALQREQLDEEIRQFNQSYQLQLDQFNEQIRQFEAEIARLKENDEKGYALEIERLEMDKEKLEEDKRRWEAEMEFQREQFEEQKRQFGVTHEGKSVGGGGGGSSASITKTSSGSSGGSGRGTHGGVKKTSSSGIDQDSVMKAGYGPLSDEGVAQYVAEGKLTATEKGGTIYVERAPDPPAQSTYLPGNNPAKGSGASIMLPWMYGYK